jgi:hypothetical protein
VLVPEPVLVLVAVFVVLLVAVFVVLLSTFVAFVSPPSALLWH